MRVMKKPRMAKGLLKGLTQALEMEKGERIGRENLKKTKKKFKYKNANKVIGILIPGLNGDPFYFRIYGKNGKFKDYDILHHDIRVQILDDSVELLESEDGEECYLDYSRKVLGQETKYKRTRKMK